MTSRSARRSGWPLTIVWMPRSVEEISISQTLPSRANPFSTSSLIAASSSSVAEASVALASYGTFHHLAYSRAAFSYRGLGIGPFACKTSLCSGNLGMSNTQPRPVMALAPGAPGQKRNLQRMHGGHVHALVSTLALPQTAHAIPVAPLPPKPLPGAPLLPFPFAGAAPLPAPLPLPLPFAAPAYVSAVEFTSLAAFLAAPCTFLSIMAILMTSLSKVMRGSEIIVDSSISHSKSRTIVECGSSSIGGSSLSMALKIARSSCERRDPSSE
jgi:hypothetical protein